jgi:hypothetical protein
MYLSAGICNLALHICQPNVPADCFSTSLFVFNHSARVIGQILPVLATSWSFAFILDERRYFRLDIGTVFPSVGSVSYR